MERTCKSCNTTKPIEEFRKGCNINKAGESIPTYRQSCKVCEREQTRKDIFYRTRGITVEQRDQMLEEQGNICAACGSTKSNSKKGWHVDHCHRTGKIRGILCSNCNIALGQVNDNVGNLYALIDYLLEHGKERATTIPKGSTPKQVEAVGPQ